MNNNKLKEYLAIYIKYLNDIKTNDKYIPTNETTHVLAILSKKRIKDSELNKLLTDLARKESLDRQHRIVAEYFLEVNKGNNVEKGKTYHKARTYAKKANAYMGGYMNIFIVSIIILVILIILGIIYKISA